jgi:hypothetical protein
MLLREADLPMVGRLGAIGAILRTGPRLDAEEAGLLDPGRIVMSTVHLVGSPDKVEERKPVKRLDLLGGPVMPDHVARSRRVL